MGVDILSFILDDAAIFLHRYLDGELPPRYRNLGLIFTWQGSICGAIVNRYPGIPGKPQQQQHVWIGTSLPKSMLGFGVLELENLVPKIEF